MTIMNHDTSHHSKNAPPILIPSYSGDIPIIFPFDLHPVAMDRLLETRATRSGGHADLLHERQCCELNGGDGEWSHELSFLTTR